ncbi:MAG: DUF1924 domain-containing protein [Gammaproteobacteria bacterium]|nr:DUF1924 domain-containing protein [Gammaproteobacteria bacterium]
MKTITFCTLLLINLSSGPALADNETVNRLLQDYATQGAISADEKQGEQLCQKTFEYNGEFAERSCNSCHSNDLTAAGKHVKTSKVIKPMSPSSNAERFTDSKKVEKWFKRNCIWTMGRECSTQEKANLTIYINKKIKFQES